MQEIEVPSRVDGKRRYLVQKSDFGSLDDACRVSRHKITHECKIPSLSIQEWWNLFSHDIKEKYTRFTMKLASLT